MYNKVILVGRLTRDVELKYAPSGTAISKFGLATNRTYKDNTTGENKQEVMFIDITVFGRSGEIANQFLRKGSKVLIEGRLILEQWIDSTGQKKSKHSIVAEKIQFMETKAEAENNQYDNQHTATSTSASASNNSKPQRTQAHKQTKPQPQPQQEEIPSINIDEEDIPF
jgi:single-strand DNA-binding protein